MSAATLQRPFLQQLHFPSHRYLSVCVSRSVPHRSLGATPVGLRKHLSFLQRGAISVRGICRCKVNSQEAPVGIRSTPAVLQMDSKLEQSGSSRKRMDSRPKELALRPGVSHGNSTISYIQILGTGMDTGDTSPSVLLFFDKRRFIFNAGEGLQRFCIEHKIKLSKLNHVFLTRVCSETAGGLPGLLLTLCGVGEAGMAVNIWGPSDLKVLVDAMRTFVPSSSVVHTHTFGDAMLSGPSRDSAMQSRGDLVLLLEDDVVKISAILLQPSLQEPEKYKFDEKVDSLLVREDKHKSSGTVDPKAAGSSFEFVEPWELGFGSEETFNVAEVKKRPRVETHLPSQFQKNFEAQELSPVKGEQKSTSSKVSHELGDIAVAYVLELPEIKGKFDPEKAKALGIRPGPKYGILQSGKSVLSDDGKKTVHPGDVMDPSSPGPICLIVDCCSTSHISALDSSQALHHLAAGDKGGLLKKVTLIVHIGPASVVKHLQYQEWMARFKGSHHVMAGHGMYTMVPPILKSSARIMSRLNMVCPQVFPILGIQQYNEEEYQNQISRLPGWVDLRNFGSTMIAENLLKFRLRPLAGLGVDRSSVPEHLNIVGIKEQLVTDIPELLSVTKKITEMWRVGSTELENTVDLTESLQEDSGKIEEPQLDVCSESRLVPANLANKQDQNLESTVETKNLLTRGGSNLLEEKIPECLKGVNREEMEIVFLGTGSSQPSKYRNVSAIYIHLFEKGGILLDCGEGTYAQLKRRYGAQGADKVLSSLKCVWISHIHADHHTGLARILSARKRLLEESGKFESILVVGPRQLKRFLEAYERLEDLGMNFLDCSQTTVAAEVAATIARDNDTRVSSDNLTTKKRGNGYAAVPAGLIKNSFVKGDIGSSKGLRPYWLQAGFNFEMGLDKVGRQKLQDSICTMGLEKLYSVPVVHCPNAFGIVLESQEKVIEGESRKGWKLVYSGDTRPCLELVEASKGATVLIHEATFDDGMPEEAIAKNHSLTREAIETGIEAGVYRTILTHFSQRYPKIPVFSESYTDRTCVAFDMMSANLADLPFLPKLLPALKLLFKDEMLTAEEEEVDTLDL